MIHRESRGVRIPGRVAFFNCLMDEHGMEFLWFDLIEEVSSVCHSNFEMYADFSYSFWCEDCDLFTCYGNLINPAFKSPEIELSKWEFITA
jgi:hypothetical protein